MLGNVCSCLCVACCLWFAFLCLVAVYGLRFVVGCVLFVLRFCFVLLFVMRCSQMCCSLFVVCCLLFFDCCVFIRFLVRCASLVVYCSLCVGHRSSLAVCCLSFVVCYLFMYLFVAFDFVVRYWFGIVGVCCSLFVVLCLSSVGH